jgi:hypothetical protein
MYVHIYKFIYMCVHIYKNIHVNSCEHLYLHSIQIKAGFFEPHIDFKMLRVIIKIVYDDDDDYLIKVTTCGLKDLSLYGTSQNGKSNGMIIM